MALHTEEVLEVSSGVNKEIEEGAEELIFELVQKEQYRYPIQSAVRELASNGLDSIREKRVAQAILSGEAKVEDYFEPLPPKAVYKDSAFKPEYYDLRWLSKVDQIDIIYRDNGELGKDTVTIRDTGVGLGGKRLEKSFNLGFSTKRLNKFTLGKFGLGAKSGLAATSNGFYTLVSRYNGEEFAFNVYEHKFESLVPAFDLETREVNKRYVLVRRDGSEYIYYSRPTTSHNGVDISFAVKKHHKQQYIDAVKGQLLYFDNIRLILEDKDGNQQFERVQADIMYEDDLIVLSNNNQYSKPHLLLNGVNYGYIDFRELELEEKLGNIGIKIKPEAVSINPSRESLIWDDKTRDTVVNKFQEVVGVATGLVNTSLQETDFIAWIRICSNISGRFNQIQNGSVVSRLSQIVSLKDLELEYPADKNVKYGAKLFTGIRAAVVTLSKEREGSKTVYIVERSKYITAHDLSIGLPFILQENSTNTSNRKDKYTLMRLYPNGFIQIHLDADWKDGAVTAKQIPDGTRLEEARMAGLYSPKKTTSERIADIQNYLMQSKDIIKYEDIEVPDDFKGDDTDLIVEQDEETEEARESAEQRRKLEGKTVLSTPRPMWSVDDKKCYEMEKREVRVEEIDKWTNEEVFYSSMDYEPLLHTVALMTRPHYDVTNVPSYGKNSDYNRCTHFSDDSPVRLIRVAKDNVKYYRDFKHITKFFRQIKKGTITMSNALIRWNTARVINERLDELAFLNGFNTIDPVRSARYKELVGYVAAYWRDLGIYKKQMGADDNTTTQIVRHCDNITQFQLFVRRNPEDKDAIAQLAQQLFNPDKGVELNDGCAIDTEKYDLYQELLDWAQPVRVLMNEMCCLVKGNTHEVTPELEDELRRYFQYRGCPL
jgi:hypothetical protein